MIDKVTWEKTTFERLPFKFEAGTPDYVATHGLAKAIEYIDAIGFDTIQQHEQELTRYCMEQLQSIDGLKIYGPMDPSKKDARSLGNSCPNGSSLCPAFDGSLRYQRHSQSLVCPL